ncbi:MAG TPA: hypothetical protein VIF40_18195 [Methylosinus sp.]|jgi:hypothetical protein|uniref:hypothetical protein n=1 Tax=Methylosinus sp. TaxID=427 RepID=UPI002F931A01
MSKPETMKGAKLYICATPQSGTLDQSAFVALTWVQIHKVGKVGGVSTTTNVVKYDTLDTDVSQKDKGITNGGDWSLELAYIYDDAGQVALRAAAVPQNKQEYAFKLEYADAPSAGYSNTIIYNKGIVTGPERPGSGVEDFILETFSLGMNQLNIQVLPTL